MSIDLSKLALPFPAEDIEWRISRAGMGKNGKPYAHCLAYITARAIYSRLDEVCEPENWQNTAPQVHELKNGVFMVAVGISIRVGEEWITKWDVAEPTNIEPAKGSFSGAMKRAGAQFGIGRYLYHLTEMFAEISENAGPGWNWAVLPEKHGGEAYFWKPPKLPAWALPKEKEHEIKRDELDDLYRAWKEKFSPESKDPADLCEGFSRLVTSVVGEFPSTDYTCWTRDMLDRVQKHINDTTEPNGISADVPL